MNKLWSRHFKFCIACKSNCYNHLARGLCARCYLKKRTKTRREYFRVKKQKERLNKNGYFVSVGRMGEIEAEKILKVEKNTRDIISDYTWKGKLVDVKTAVEKNDAWKFLLYRQKGKIDYFLLILKDKQKKTLYMFLVPDKDIKKNNLRIGKKKLNNYCKYILKGW